MAVDRDNLVQKLRIFASMECCPKPHYKTVLAAADLLESDGPELAFLLAKIDLLREEIPVIPSIDFVL